MVYRSDEEEHLRLRGKLGKLADENVEVAAVLHRHRDGNLPTEDALLAMVQALAASGTLAEDELLIRKLSNGGR